MENEQLFGTNLQPGISIDCVIFGFHENQLKVLLLQVRNSKQWALPGGFIEVDRDADDQADRILRDRTGLGKIFLQQFHLFGEISRNKSGYAQQLVKDKVIPEYMEFWFEQRFMTIGYYALVEYSKVQKLTPDFVSDDCKWCALRELPALILDHNMIITKAHQTLKKELNYQPIGLNLLPEYFTMPELQALYETVLEKKLDRRNFRRKMLSYDILITTNKHRTGGPHKAPMLYAFDKKKYADAIQGGLKSGW